MKASFSRSSVPEPSVAQGLIACRAASITAYLLSSPVSAVHMILEITDIVSFKIITIILSARLAARSVFLVARTLRDTIADFALL